jgi:peptidoglycan-associated lipoprotein
MRKLRHLGLVAVVVILGLLMVSGCAWFKTEEKAQEPPPGAAKEEGTKRTAEAESKKMEGKPEATVKEEASLQDIFFDFDKHNVRSDQRAAIDQGAAWLRNNAAVKIVIEGHCDERGTSEYNMALGDRRAKNVKEALVSRGVNAKSIKTISYGKEKPFDAGHNEEAWAKNRRGHFVIEK